MSSSTSSSSSQQQHPHLPRPQIAILDFGSQYSHLIARRLRELHVFCELYSCLVTKSELFGDDSDDHGDNHHNNNNHDNTTTTSKPNNIIGIILSGGPNSVYDPTAPHVVPEVWDEIAQRNIPLLGICYGMQVCMVYMSLSLSSSSSSLKEYILFLFLGVNNEKRNEYPREREEEEEGETFV